MAEESKKMATMAAEDAEIYSNCVRKGKKFAAAMEEDPGASSPSIICVPNGIWTKYHELEKNGWVRSLEDITDPDHECFGPQEVLPKILDEHDIDLERRGATNMWIWTHHGTTVQSSSVYPATAAQYENVYNFQDGTIFAFSNHSPSYQVAEAKANGEPWAQNLVIPAGALQHWADVVYLAWKEQQRRAVEFGTVTRSLRRIVRHNVMNETAAVVIDKIQQGLPPGHKRIKLTATSGDDFFALLGCPNGTSIGYLLAQHKGSDQLGWCTVDSITAWFGKKRCLVFEIEKHPEAGVKHPEAQIKHPEAGPRAGIGGDWSFDGIPK